MPAALPLTLRTAFQNLRAPQKWSRWVWEASRVENCENVHLATLATAARFLLLPSEEIPQQSFLVNSGRRGNTWEGADKSFQLQRTWEEAGKSFEAIAPEPFC